MYQQLVNSEFSISIVSDGDAVYLPDRADPGEERPALLGVDLLDPGDLLGLDTTLRSRLGSGSLSFSDSLSLGAMEVLSATHRGLR